MATQPTNLPVPSESPRDLKFNAGKIDEFVTSMGWTYTDRFGVQHYTIEGMRWLAQQAIAGFGYITIDSFEDGNTLTLPNQVLRLEATGEYYRWDGQLPKNVPASSTPESTGGIGSGAWISVGDAALRQNLASSANGLGDNLITVKQPFTGSKPRSQHDKNAESISVLDFEGADPTGASDSTAAFQAALNAYNDVYIPPGTYLISGNLTKNAAPLCLRGAGVGITNLICSAVSGAVIKHTPTSGDHFFNFCDFTMIGAAPSTAGVQAIWIDGSAQITTSIYKNMHVTGEREKRRGIIKNISYRALDSTHGFGKGLRITALLNFTMQGMDFTGASSAFATEAFAIDGDGVPVDIRAHDLYAYNVVRAFNMPDYVEGLYMRDCEFVGVTEGVCNYFQTGRSVLTSSSVPERSNGNKIGPIHVSFKGTQGIRLDGAAYVKIRGCLIFAQNDAQAQKSHIYVSNTNFATISDNMLVGDASVVTGNASFGIVGDILTNSIVSGNQCNGLFEAVHLTDNSVTNVIADNYALGFSGATAVSVLGNNSVQNMLRNNKGASTTASVTAAGNRLTAVTYAKGYSITLVAGSAGGSQQVTITVPSNVFPSTPAIAILVGVNGSGLLCELVPASSTATSLVFNVRMANGSAIGAGTYGMTLFASSNIG